MFILTRLLCIFILQNDELWKINKMDMLKEYK